MPSVMSRPSDDARRGVGSNLLMHDGGQAGIGQDRWHTVKATADLLDEWKGRVRFVTVAELAARAYV